MLLTIFNLPAKTRYSDIKSLILTKCGFTDLILDNLTHGDNNSKKVTVGLAEEEDAAILVRKINGLFVDGRQIYVETVTKKQDNNQKDLYKPHERPAYESGNQMQTKMPTLQQPYYQQNSYQQPSHKLGYRDIQQNVAIVVPAHLSHAGMYGASTAQNAFANYGYPQQMLYQSTSQVTPQPFGSFDQGAPLGFNNQGNNTGSWSNQNDWKVVGNQNSHQSSSNSRWNNPGDSNSRSNRDAASHDHGRNAPSRSYGRDAPSRDSRRTAFSHDRVRGAPVRDRSRDTSVHDRGRESRARGRGKPGPHHGRGVPSGDHGRDARHRSNEHNQTPSKEKFSSYDPPPLLISYPKIYGDHVTDPSHQVAKFPQQRNRSKPFYIQNKPEANDYFPPVKRQRKGLGFGNQSNEPKAYIPVNKNKFTPPVKKDKHKNNPKMTALRSITWRCQIASSIAKEIISNPNLKNDIDPALFRNELKRAVRHRLQDMFSDNYEARMVEMLKKYRNIYDRKSDEDLYKEVTEDIKKKGSDLADEVKTEDPVKTEQEEDQQQQQGPSGDTKNIPSYPQGDKRLNKQQKKTNQEIFEDQDVVVSKLQPSMKKVLEESVDEIRSLILDEFSEEPEPDYKELHERIKTSVVYDLKKALKVNFAKRVLNMGPIMLRIFTTPKVISRGKLAPLLAEHGVTSLRKSEGKKHNMYIGTCATYTDHDKLCSMEPIVVENSTVTIKPFQLVGQKEKLSKQQYKKNRKIMTQSFANAYEGEQDLGDEEEDDDIKMPNVDDNSQDQAENVDQDMETAPNENKANEMIETSENEDTNENVDEQQEDNENEDKTNAEVEETNTVETKSNEEHNEESNLDLLEENLPCVTENEMSTTEKDNFEDAGDKPTDIDDNDILPHVEDGDCTADGNNENSLENAPFSECLEMDDELKSENLEDIEGQKDYEDIDIDDVHEDDLEDWASN